MTLERDPRLPDITKLLNAREEEVRLIMDASKAREKVESAKEEIVRMYEEAGVTPDYCDHPIKSHYYGTADNYCICCSGRVD